MVTIICSVIGIMISASLKVHGVNFGNETFDYMFYAAIPVGLGVIGHFFDDFKK